MSGFDDLRGLAVELESVTVRLRRLASMDASPADGVDVSAQRVGENLLRLRNPVCSQAVLAARMRDRGFKWSAATVWAIEKGERCLRFDEAVLVLGCLGLDVTSLPELYAPKEGDDVSRN
ncbi:hypothetical protein [Bifidobacterium tissieri]|uniref:hypothetical protein n=1 Tax=Bifidobacterium tissieri TaxID=1630162 RepID=UPI00123915DE|nr:hypothetical protein [Bifidobacterium tissieri]KAA8831812.1 hypothetical protein EM849_07330 [Bifidobacterium tissieri]